MTDLLLTAEQEAEAQVFYEKLRAAFDREALHLARVLASKEDRQLLGGTEFDVRQRVLRLGATVLQTALDERKKGGTKVRA